MNVPILYYYKLNVYLIEFPSPSINHYKAWPPSKPKEERKVSRRESLIPSPERSGSTSEPPFHSRPSPSVTPVPTNRLVSRKLKTPSEAEWSPTSRPTCHSKAPTTSGER